MDRPVGNLLLRTLAMPGDTNPAGDIFGGWIMSQMDISGAILAGDIAGGRVVTVAVEAMSFLQPVRVGDIVCCYGHCVHVGNTSLKIRLEIWVRKQTGDECPHARRAKVTEAVFTYVAVNGEGRPRPLPESARTVAQVGIDADSAGLNADGSVRR